MAEAAGKNQLCWCLKAQTSSAAAFGFDKKLRFITKWELVGPDGKKLKIDTVADSQETYGKFPNGADPKLEPVYLELAKNNVKQFLDELSKTSAL